MKIPYLRPILNYKKVEVRTLNPKDPVGKKAWHADEGGVEILGVLKDFNYASLHNNIDPLVLDYRPNAAN
jgi:putative ABC transport system permease protein